MMKIDFELGPRASFFVASILLLVLWRVLRFTILPLLWPDEPKTLPYWIPYFGSAIQFFRNSHAVLTLGLSKNSNREPFTVTLVGEDFYVVTNPSDVAQLYKNNTTLSFDMFVQELMLSCGTSARSVDDMGKRPPPYTRETRLFHSNPSGKSVIQLAIDFHHIQLLPGPNSKANDLIQKFLKRIANSLTWERVYNDARVFSKQSYEIVEGSLLEWCGKVLVEAGTTTYYGQSLWEIEPDLLDIFYTFDHGMWKILFHYPRVFSRDAFAARDRLINAVDRYFALPKDQRKDESWFTDALEAEQRSIGMSEREMAATVIIIFFVINGNTYKLCFWILCHILTDSDLLAAVKAEIDPENTNAEPTIEHLTNSCPVLDSILCEVLRLYTSSASMRYILSDTHIGGKLLRKGKKVMIPYRQLHENTDVYGPDALRFNPYRFLENKALKRNPSFRPFGGGATYCAGRIIAQQEVLIFVGIALSRYDIQLVKTPTGGQQAFPRVENTKPTLGMMAPIWGEDFRINVRRRSC